MSQKIRYVYGLLFALLLVVPVAAAASKTLPTADAVPLVITSRSSGSGWVVGDGLVVTAKHVIAGQGRIGVVFASSASEATVVCTTTVGDLAILKPVTAPGAALPVRGTPLVIRSRVVLLGYAGGRETLSALRAEVVGTGSAGAVDLDSGPFGLPLGYHYYLRVAPPLGRIQGMSGGPVLDEHGQVAAVISGQHVALLDRVVASALEWDDGCRP